MVPDRVVNVRLCDRRGRAVSSERKMGRISSGSARLGAGHLDQGRPPVIACGMPAAAEPTYER